MTEMEVSFLTSSGETYTWDCSKLDNSHLSKLIEGVSGFGAMFVPASLAFCIKRSLLTVPDIIKTPENFLRLLILVYTGTVIMRHLTSAPAIRDSILLRRVELILLHCVAVQR